MNPRDYGPLLSHGNSKLGSIFCFGVPAVEACPGASSLCIENCYARKRRFRLPRVQDRLRRSLEAIHYDPFFAERIMLEIQTRRVRLLRLYDSGDFTSTTDVRRWARVVRHCRTTEFYCYTRAWRLSAVRQALEDLLMMEGNFSLWFSADAETGLPPDVPVGVRVAWLQTSHGEKVPRNVDLVFRVHSLRTEPGGRIPLSLVCPTERPEPVEGMTCESCSRCWR